MKCVIIFDEEDLKDYKTDKGSWSITLTNKEGFTRVKKLVPMIRPLAINTDGKFVYLQDGHIDCIKKYEEEHFLKKMIDDMCNDYFDFHNLRKCTLMPYNFDNCAYKFKDKEKEE